ncbi:hypothetical protein NPIL_56501 [Nephila pilipes]|uniref:Uncharacterized protein n=1 Tax=Nephila pilipes TaxID=299642 RepID=A0A8X6NYB6_NEPPI|nr:hypothetical protein NPIL_56501 [Nephila pilipes]
MNSVQLPTKQEQPLPSDLVSVDKADLLPLQPSLWLNLAGKNPKEGGPDETECIFIYDSRWTRGCKESRPCLDAPIDIEDQDKSKIERRR